jgi:hypothetical protein
MPDAQEREGLARGARERWRVDAPAGHRVLLVPAILVPTHAIVIELWDETFVAGSPTIQDTLLGFGSTPFEAVREHERVNFGPLFGDVVRRSLKCRGR